MALGQAIRHLARHACRLARRVLSERVTVERVEQVRLATCPHSARPLRHASGALPLRHSHVVHTCESLECDEAVLEPSKLLATKCIILFPSTTRLSVCKHVALSRRPVAYEFFSANVRDCTDLHCYSTKLNIAGKYVFKGRINRQLSAGEGGPMPVCQNLLKARCT